MLQQQKERDVSRKQQNMVALVTKGCEASRTKHSCNQMKIFP